MGWLRNMRGVRRFPLREGAPSSSMRAQIVMEHLILIGLALTVFLILLVFTFNRFEKNMSLLERQAVTDTAEMLDRLITALFTADPGASYDLVYPGSTYGIPITLIFGDGGFTVASSQYTTSRSIPFFSANVTVTNATIVFLRTSDSVTLRIV